MRKAIRKGFVMIVTMDGRDFLTAAVRLETMRMEDHANRSA
jgi:hypothetical protein